MDQVNYKERLEALRKARFTSVEIERLSQFRRTYIENELDQAPADLSGLQFILWLVVHGRLTDQIARSNFAQINPAC